MLETLESWSKFLAPAAAAVFAFVVAAGKYFEERKLFRLNQEAAAKSAPTVALMAATNALGGINPQLTELIDVQKGIAASLASQVVYWRTKIDNMEKEMTQRARLIDEIEELRRAAEEMASVLRRRNTLD